MGNLQEKAGKILDLLLVGIEKGAEAVGNELPNLVNEYITMYIIDLIPVVSPLFFIAGIIILLFIRRTFKKQIIKAKDHEKDDITISASICAIIVGIVMLVPLGHIISSAKDVFKVKYAPKAYIIEKIRKSVGENNSCAK